jgi:uncharacterized repeat protein (TIGR03803 family)
MHKNKPCIERNVARVVAILALFAVQVWAGTGTAKVLHNFNPQQGSHPMGVTLGPDGNLYGVTVLGGSYGAGTVFELTPAAGGRWLETRVLDFGRKGAYPNPLIFAPDGNLYGTTEIGPNGSCGGVFELSLNAAGHWEEKVLHSLSCAEGLYPLAPLVRDSAGNLYGTAWGGGAYDSGTVFELSPTGGGDWTFKVIHSFNGTDGSEPQSDLTLDASGNLYGMALCGGSSGAVRAPSGAGCAGAPGLGTVWELSPQSDGSWNETTLYSFADGDDGANPSILGQVSFDSTGNLYGTTENGGAFGRGAVFELSPNGDGTWAEKLLHSFDGEDGIDPSGTLVADGSGNFYGEAFGPGCYNPCGSGGETGGQLVYKLAPNLDGSWSETVVHRFSDPVGGGPAMGLTMDGAGNLYGTTWLGGTDNNGEVFEITL